MTIVASALTQGQRLAGVVQAAIEPTSLGSAVSCPGEVRAEKVGFGAFWSELASKITNFCPQQIYSPS